MDTFDRVVISVLIFGAYALGIISLDKAVKLDKQINPEKVECIK